jgi:hypothetical protein
MSRLTRIATRTCALALTPAVLLTVAALGGQPASGQEQVIVIDTVALTAVGDGDGDPKALNGVPFNAAVENGVAVLHLLGDLMPSQKEGWS